jgi:hypothetical protein
MKKHSERRVFWVQEDCVWEFLIYRVNSGKRDVGGIPARTVVGLATYTGLTVELYGSNELSMVKID